MDAACQRKGRRGRKGGLGSQDDARPGWAKHGPSFTVGAWELAEYPAKTRRWGYLAGEIEPFGQGLDGVSRVG